MDLGLLTRLFIVIQKVKNHSVIVAPCKNKLECLSMVNILNLVGLPNKLYSGGFKVIEKIGYSVSGKHF